MLERFGDVVQLARSDHEHSIASSYTVRPVNEARVFFFNTRISSN